MVNAYTVRYILYINDEKINTYCREILTNEKPQNEETINVNWNNLEDFRRQHGVYFAFSVRNKKKGRIIYPIQFFCDFPIIKEWKNKELNMKCVIQWELSSLPIKNIMEYSNGELAIQYLVERGFNIIKMGG